jgi:hypothetical protein
MASAVAGANFGGLRAWPQWGPGAKPESNEILTNEIHILY